MLNMIKEQFINDTKEGSKVHYSRKLTVFIEFLEEKCGVNNQNFKETLRGIGVDKILSSIEYYVHEYGVQYKVTIDNYFTVIKAFFTFIKKNQSIINPLFDSIAELEKLNEKVNIKCKELRLNKTTMKEIMNEEEFKVLLNACNTTINSYDVSNYNYEGVHKTDAGLFISAIIMKLVMYTGIKNTVVPTILKKDYNFELNTILINGIKLDLPDDLAYNFKKYRNVRDKLLRLNGKIESDNDDRCLFITQKGEYMSKAESSEIYRLMNKELNYTEGEKLCKYAIMKQIEEGLDVLQIMELTRFGFDTCMHCREELTLSLDKNKTNDIALKLRGSRLYQIL